MPSSTRQSIYQAIASIRLIDPHTHIDPHSPASNTLADLLGYHYYTELAHSAGMSKDQIEEEGIGPRELVGRLVANLGPIENTAQYRWLVEICRKFFGFEGDRIDQSNWENVYSMAESRMASAEWPQMVLDQSNVEAVFLTNDFDDSLEGFDSDTYIPCLRTDDLVFHLAKQQTRGRLSACTGIDLDGSLNSLRRSLRQRFDHFVRNGARACAISLPPSFQPTRVSDGRAQNALDHVLRNDVSSDPSHQSALSQRVFWTLAELCDEFGLPFDLMIGVNRGVYPGGVFQGQDLYDSRVSLIQYAELFNAFPEVKFPVSVLASVTNQELVSYSWIFPNVITNGHWWYSNTPSFIARDAMARLEAVPQTKQIAYYSDAYKLEFVWPKFDMYRNVLAGILADHFVEGCGWSEERAIELGRQVLRDNVDRIFPKLSNAASSTGVDPKAETWVEVSDAEEDEFVNFDDGSLPTTVDEPGITETVRIDDDEDPPGDGTNDTVRLQEHDSEQDHEFDPLPTHSEIQAVDVDDVTLKEFSAESNAIDHEQIESEADPERLDVGDLLGDKPVDADDAGIEMLEGQESFFPDSESLQTKPDPETGEWTLPYPDSNDDSDSLDSEDDLLKTIDLTADEGESEFDFELAEEDDETDETS